MFSFDTPYEILKLLLLLRVHFLTRQGAKQASFLVINSKKLTNFDEDSVGGGIKTLILGFELKIG